MKSLHGECNLKSTEIDQSKYKNTPIIGNLPNYYIFTQNCTSFLEECMQPVFKLRFRHENCGFMRIKP